MRTNEWTLHDETEQHDKQLEKIAATLREGEVVAFPTETVYGLGANATDEQAVRKIFKAKGRPQDNPLIAHVATKEALKNLVCPYHPYVDTLIDTFSPGPITYILPSSGVCADNVTAGLDTVGVRIPDHPVAQAILQACRFPIAAPSANTSGKPSPTTAAHVKEDLYGKIAGIVDGGRTGVGMESTIIDCTAATPVILRPGGVTKEQILACIGGVIDVIEHVDTSERPQAPGMKYTHYAPDAPLVLVQGDARALQATINTYQKDGKRVGVLARTSLQAQIKADRFVPLGESFSEIATRLYSSLRMFKREEVDVIVCESFKRAALGEAIMNRLEKAATTIIDESF